MFFLITTVFIAQVVIVINILYFLINTDKKVLSLLKITEKNSTKLKWRIRLISEISDGINHTLIPKYIKNINIKREDITINLLRKVLQSGLIFSLKGYRKIYLGLKIGYFFGKAFLKS